MPDTGSRHSGAGEDTTERQRRMYRIAYPLRTMGMGLGEAARAALPTRLLTEAEARTLSFGQRLPSLDPGRSTPVAALDPSGQLVAVLDESRSATRSLVVFTPASS